MDIAPAPIKSMTLQSKARGVSTSASCCQDPAQSGWDRRALLQIQTHFPYTPWMLCSFSGSAPQIQHHWHRPRQCIPHRSGTENPGPHVPKAPRAGILPLPCSAGNFPPHPWGMEVLLWGGKGTKSKVPAERRSSARRRQREVLTGCEPWLSSSRRGRPSLAFPSLSGGSSARRGHRALWDHPKHGFTS